MNNKLLHNRVFLTVSISLFIFLLLLVLSSPFYVINEKIKSFIIKTKNEIYLLDTTKVNKLINNDIVVINFDEKTLDKLGFPISRRDYKPIIENLNNAGAEIIAFDIIFANNNNLDIEGDDIFAKSIKDAGNVILGGAIISKTFSGQTIGVIEKPLDKFLTGALAFGYYQPNVDMKSNVVTSFRPSAKIYDVNKNLSTYNHFGISILKAYYSKIYEKNYLNYENSDKDFYYLRSDYRVPFLLSNSNDILINFVPLPVGAENKYSKFISYSFLDVYENKIDPNAFDGKIVLVGATAKGIKDIFTTPNGIEYGVYVLSNIVNTMLTKNYLLYLDKNLELFLIFSLILLSVYFNLSRSGYVLVFSNISISIIFLVIFPISVLIFTSYLLNHLFELFFALILSLTISNMVKYITENKNKNKLNKALSEYVSKAIADEILSNSGKINLDGERKKLAIYFSDIEGFTTISEKFEPEFLVGFLRDYLSEMSDIIMDSNGFINKYEGDAIMALWGAFTPYDNSSYYSCLSALKQQKRLSELNEIWGKKGFSTIKVRIGLHVGEAIVGNIGSTGRKMEFTALGDSVNLASRLEGVNKFYGTYICVSESIYEEVKDLFEFRYLDKIRVKGKNKPVKIYELLGLKNEVSDERLEIKNQFEKAVKLYLKRDFLGAKKIFEKLIKQGDNAPQIYLDMCEIYMKTPPSDDWDGVSTMSGK
ncbi:MAG: adenylate/guanylate cyclase domain-containing protein [Candidatus Gracilibacteria bacterium]|nr:adenylate/guanylate cyclase domain-containing protein [Candidatus Gracilibacteria bacterium]